MFNKMPGYTAQNKTFCRDDWLFNGHFDGDYWGLLIYPNHAKLPNYAVLRAQGIPAKTLTLATVNQAALLMVSGGDLEFNSNAVDNVGLTPKHAILIDVAVGSRFNVGVSSAGNAGGLNSSKNDPTRATIGCLTLGKEGGTNEGN